MPYRHCAEHKQRIEILEALVESHQQAVVALSTVMMSALPIAMKAMTEDERVRFSHEVLPLLQDVRHDLNGRARTMQRTADLHKSTKRDTP